MRPPSWLLLLAALLPAAPAHADSSDGSTGTPHLGSRYVLLDVPYTAAQAAQQRYITLTGTRADPWAFSHGLLTLVGVRPSGWDFRDTGGQVLRVTTTGSQPAGLYRLTYEPALSRTWSGRAWAYGGLSYACRFRGDESLALRLSPGQPLSVTGVYRVQGRHPGVFHRNTFGAGTLFSDEPVGATSPLLVELTASGWMAEGGAGASLEAIQRNENLAPAVCKHGFLPLLDQGGLGRSLSALRCPPDRTRGGSGSPPGRGTPSTGAGPGTRFTSPSGARTSRELWGRSCGSAAGATGDRRRSSTPSPLRMAGWWG